MVGLPRKPVVNSDTTTIQLFILASTSEKLLSKVIQDAIFWGVDVCSSKFAQVFKF
jgi:hypothetical protein